MKNVYQGGQCNPNAIGATSNHYKRAMNQMATGGQIPERVIDHSQRGVSFENELAQRQAMMKQMNGAFKESEKQFMSERMAMNQMMGKEFQIAQLERQRHLNMMQEMEWNKHQEQIMRQQMAMQQQFENASLQHEANSWTNEKIMEDQHSHAKVSFEEEQKSILNSSSSMLDVMMNDPDPRFQNSEFLGFLKKIQNGQLMIQGKEITEVKPDQKMMEGAWGQAQKTHQMNMKNMEGNFENAKELQEKQRLNSQKSLQQNWANKLQQYEKEYADSENFEKMLEQKYMQVLKEMNLDLTEAWQSSTDLEQEMVHGQIRQHYTFAKNNPYMEVAFPKQAAWEMMNKGRNNEAILALEAHLQKNANDSESWRILGRVLQENDQDQKSIPCFMNSVEHNPQNLDSLLSLGVSCTNILDEVKAMNYLKKWIIFNPKYKELNVDPNIIPDENTNQYTYKIEEIKAMNANLIKVFDQAVKMNPNDPELLTALAILFFVKRQYETSIDLFNRALKFDPTNYLLMNKIGAALAHLGRADQAIKFYHHALNIRPNYVRVWVNIGIAHAFKGMYDEAARFYLNALEFRPDAKHVWSYLHTCFMSMQRYDLISKISTQDPKAFNQFEVINAQELPDPEIEYRITTQKHILNRNAENWIQEVNKKQ